MFYSNNDNYMEDLYFYNQIPNGTYINTFGNNVMQNPNVGISQGGIPANTIMFQQTGFIPNNYSCINLNNSYPSIYKILNPVISKVISNNNQPITDDLLSNMTDTVFNIVEGQINLEDDQIQNNSQKENQTNINSNSSQNKNPEFSRTINNQNQIKNNRNDHLLKDFIKTLIIKELVRKYNCQRLYRT